MSALPKWRCYHCDNGIDFEWEFCAWCGASERWKTAEDRVAPKAVSDAVLNDILKATGEWCEPYTAPRESGVPVDNDISQEDADSINADGRERYRGILAIAWSAITGPEKDVTALVEAHQMEVRVLYESLERALSHFAAMGGEHAERAAQEIEELLAGVAEQSGAGAPETSVRCGAPAANSSALPSTEKIP